MNPTIFAIPIVTGVLGLAFAVWFLRRFAARHEAAQAAFLATMPGKGALAVPVRQLTLRGGGLFGAKARNSLAPELTIAADGLHYRVLRRGVLPYAGIAGIDLRKGLFGYVLVFTGTDGWVLSADIGDDAVVRRVLAALPAGLPLTPRAAAAR